MSNYQLSAQKSAYQLYDAKGKKVSYKTLHKKAISTDVILFGELHNNPIAHWLQHELTKDCFQSNPAMILGAEMFETDQQDFLNLYLQNKINARELKDTTKLWSNFDTDYKPLVNFAKTHQLPFIATNVPRKYARIVSKQGLTALDDLPENEKKLIAPLPIEFDSTLSSYQAMADMVRDHAHGMSPYNFMSAQAIKDATMANHILKYWKPGILFLHFNGAYHSDIYQGIYWFLKKKKPELKILTISTVEQIEINQLNPEFLGKADFILCVPETMTKTYE